MNKKNLFTIATGTLVGLLFFFRFYKLYEFVTFLSDQGRDAIILKRIITFEHFPAIGAPSSVGQVYLGPFYYYLVAPFLALFRFDPVGPAFGVALISIVSIITMYLIIKKEFSVFAAMVFLAMVTFSATLTEYSRFSWNPNLLPYFSFFTLYFYSLWLGKPTLRNGIIFGTLLGFSIQLHYLGSLLFLPMIFLFGYFLFLHKSIKPFIYSLFSAIVAFILSISPLIIFDLRHNFLNARQFLALFTEGGLSGGSAYYQRLFVTINNLFLHGLQIQSPIVISIFLFLIITASGYTAYRQSKSTLILLHLLNLIFYILSFAFLGSMRLPHYYGPVILSLYLTVTVGIMIMQNNKFRVVLSIFIVISMIFLNVPKMYYLFEKGNNQIQEAKNIALSITKRIKKQPIQTIALPSIESDGHYRYFLEVDGFILLPQDSPDQPDELYVICQKTCNPTGDGQWQIAAFSNKFLDTQWNEENVTIFKFIHKKI